MMHPFFESTLATIERRIESALDKLAGSDVAESARDDLRMALSEIHRLERLQSLLLQFNGELLAKALEALDQRVRHYAQGKPMPDLDLETPAAELAAEAAAE